MKILVVFLLLLKTQLAFPQKVSDIEFVFKAYLFINSPHITNSSIEKKDSAFFIHAVTNTVIRLDTLFSEGFPKNFLFLSLNMLDTSKLKVKDVNIESFLIGNNCSKLILLYDNSAGKYYRLGGFEQNDFLSFWKDIRELNLEFTKSLRLFIKHYSVEGIDFECLFESTKSNDYDPIKYPCSKRCLEMFKIN